MRASSLFALVALLAVVLACDHTTSAAPAGSAAPPSKGNTMSGFVKASSAFREHAIKVLGTSAVDSGPNNEKVAMPHTIGGAWAFNAQPTGKPERPLRGWALADGTVITVDHNFGRLLGEAGLWATPRGDFYKVQSAVAWALGNGYQTRGDAAIQLQPDGAGTIAFELAYQQVGGGAQPSGMSAVSVAITVAKDRTATVAVTKRP